MNTSELTRQRVDALWQQLQTQLTQCDLRQECALATETYEQLTAIAQEMQNSDVPEMSHQLTETIEKTQRLCEAFHLELQYALEWASHLGMAFVTARLECVRGGPLS